MIEQLWMVRESSDPHEWLALDKDDADFARPATDADLTLEAMANCLDQDAESINAHDFVDAHRLVAALLYQEVGRAVATRIMRQLVRYRGIHGALGVCGYGEPKAVGEELGVPLATGRDEAWKLGE